MSAASERRPRLRGRRPALPPFLLLTAALVISMVLSLGFGAAQLPVSDVVDVLRARFRGEPSGLTSDTIVWNLRTPRVLLAAIVGAGLAVAGCAIQTLVRNPLADPYLLGISSGASVGATAVITIGIFSAAGTWALSLGALVGALAAALIVFGIAMAQGGLTPLRLVLTGTVLSSAFSAMASFLVFRSEEPQAAQSVLFWLLGSLTGATWAKLWLPLATVIVVTALLLVAHRWMDALGAGPDVAGALGVPVTALRTAVFVLQAILVGVLVAVAGGIGFVGLILPHISRILVGPRHARLLPVAAVAGALFVVWVDVAARTLVIPREIPLSVVTGLIGAPVFLFLLGRRHYKFGGSS